jgi:hypothetical protein
MTSTLDSITIRATETPTEVASGYYKSDPFNPVALTVKANAAAQAQALATVEVARAQSIANDIAIVTAEAGLFDATIVAAARDRINTASLT